MKSYEELLSDIEEDMELMGSSHIVYSMEEDGVVTDYDYLPSDSCTISITLKELQEKLQLQMLYTKVSAHTAGADKNAPKLAVVFPGIGYTADKPLLYYTSRLASKQGYQIRTVSYDNLPENVKGDPEKMKQAFDLALEQTERSLSSIDWNSYGSVLFISKSIGTVISSAYASRHDLTVKSILFTPLAETFSFPLAGSIAFHGRRSLGRNRFHTGTGSAERCPSLSHPKRQPFSGNRGCTDGYLYSKNHNGAGPAFYLTPVLLFFSTH